MPPGDTGQSDIVSAMQQLGSRGLTRILVEGGNHVASSLFAADLLISWYGLEPLKFWAMRPYLLLEI